MAAPEFDVPPEADLRILSVDDQQVSIEESDASLQGAIACAGVPVPHPSAVINAFEISAGKREVGYDPLEHRPMLGSCTEVGLDNARAGVALAQEAVAYARENKEFLENTRAGLALAKDAVHYAREECALLAWM